MKILRDILSFTRSFMINTRSLVGILENWDRKVIKTIPCYTADCFKSSCLQLLSECVWCNVTPDLYRHNCHATDIALTERLGSNGFYIIFSDKLRQTKHDSNAVYYFSDPTNVGCFFALSLPPSADSAKINIISMNGKQDAARRLEATLGKHGFLCYIFWLRVIIKALLKQISLYLLSHFRITIIVLTCPDNKSARNQPKSCVHTKSYKSQWCEANIISIEIFAPFQFIPVNVKTREYHHSIFITTSPLQRISSV